MPGGPFVDERIAPRGHGSTSEDVRELLREDRQRLRSLLFDGAASASTAPVNESYFDGLRERTRRLLHGKRDVPARTRKPETG